MDRIHTEYSRKDIFYLKLSSTDIRDLHIDDAQLLWQIGAPSNEFTLHVSLDYWTRNSQCNIVHVCHIIVYVVDKAVLSTMGDNQQLVLAPYQVPQSFTISLVSAIHLAAVSDRVTVGRIKEGVITH